MRWLIDLWHWQQRKIDLMILWPSCRNAAREKGVGIEVAQAAFALHAFHDRAWMTLGEDEIMRRIDQLKE